MADETATTTTETTIVPSEAPATESTPPVDPAATPPAESASADEKILGKFNDVEALKKAYTSLETKLNGRAPKEYVIDTVESEGFRFNREDPIFKEFTATAKTANLSQAQAEAMLGVYKKEILSKTLNAAEEVKKLGSDGKEQINTVRNWLSNNLSKQNFDTFAPLINSASTVRALQELKNKLRQQHVPGQPPGGHNTGASTQEQRDSFMRDNWQKIKSGDPLTLKQFDEIFSNDK